MKALFAFILITLGTLLSVNQAEAQTVTWPYGEATVMDQTTISSNTDLTVSNRMSYQRYKATSDLTLNLPDIETRKGGFLFLEIAADATNRTISFGTNLVAADETITSNKTSVACFIHNGDEYIIYSIKQTD